MSGRDVVSWSSFRRSLVAGRDEQAIVLRREARADVRHTEFWVRMERALGPTYARSWAHSQVIASLGERTVAQALADGEDAKQVWREVWSVLELPPQDR
jgi:hypothetical protein